MIKESVSGEFESFNKSIDTELEQTLKKPLSRMKFLQLIGGLSAMAMLPAPTFGRGRVLLTMTTTKLFDIRDNSIDQFRNKEIGAGYMQTSAWDDINDWIYVVTTKNSSLGEFFVKKLNTSGTLLGTMTMAAEGTSPNRNGFGHGVSIGVEPRGAGNEPYIWTEADGAEAVGGDAYGDKLCRFIFSAGSTYTPSNSNITKYPISGVDNTVACSIDQYYGNITVRSHRPITGGTMACYKVYNFASFKAGGRTTIASFDQPSGLGTFQGFTSFGSYLYLLDGSKYTSTNTPPDGNTYLTSVDMNTGIQVDRALTRAGSTLTYREPEGITIHVTDPSNPDTGRLYFGFLCKDSLGNELVSMFYKDLLYYLTPVVS